jgi:Cu-Zn family superoxide dismutase
MRRFAILGVLLAVGCSDEDLPLPDDDDDRDPQPDPDALVWTANVVGEPGYESLIGEATVTQGQNTDLFSVELVVRGDEPGAERPWHVHFGTCATSGVIVGSAEEYRPLAIDEGGFALGVARVTEPLDPRNDYHVNIHLSPASLSTIIACGRLDLAE